ncbi:hypothetical protein MBLNU230_g2135t1 [Neophaeotheca triangularis]
MATRANTARHVRQRKLNTKQGLRVLDEEEVDEIPDEDAQPNIPQVETGVEKGEEVEYHLQAILNASTAAALGAKTEKVAIPTPHADEARDVQYTNVYTRLFAKPTTYIRFSSTVEDCISVHYCADDQDLTFLAKLNDGKDVEGRSRKDKLGQCSEELFEEVMNFFEETSQRVQPFATVDNAPILPLDELERHIDDTVSLVAQKWFDLIYQYWVTRKGSRPLMPTIKVKVLDTTSEADDADPYVCFRRREGRQTRKTRGRDNQVADKLKKLRLELEEARNILRLVVTREQVNKQQLEVERKVFEDRGKLKKVKVEKQIVGEKDEDLLVNQKPAPKKSRQDNGQRPPTIRIRSGGEKQAPENDLVTLEDVHGEARAAIDQSVEQRKEQHKRWNQSWVDRTWHPITPPPDADAVPQKWGPLFKDGASYPSPPPTIPSEGSQEAEDTEMPEAPPADEDATTGAEQDFRIFSVPGAYPESDVEEAPKRDPNPACRLRYGRGGRCFLESRNKRRKLASFDRGVVSDSDSDEEDGSVGFFGVPDRITFDYRVALTSRARTDSGMGGGRQHTSNETGTGGHGQSNHQAVAVTVQRSTPNGSS